MTRTEGSLLVRRVIRVVCQLVADFGGKPLSVKFDGIFLPSRFADKLCWQFHFSVTRYSKSSISCASTLGRHAYRQVFFYFSFSGMQILKWKIEISESDRHDIKHIIEAHSSLQHIHWHYTAHTGSYRSLLAVSLEQTHGWRLPLATHSDYKSPATVHTCVK